MYLSITYFLVRQNIQINYDYQVFLLYIDKRHACVLVRYLSTPSDINNSIVLTTKLYDICIVKHLYRII